MITCRLASLEDVDALLRVRVDFMRDVGAIKSEEDKKVLLESNRRYLTSALSDGSYIQWLAQEDGEIVATCGVSFYMLPPNMARLSGRVGYIANVYTYPSHRGQGLASKLLKNTIESCRKEGCDEIFLDATDMGRPIYERFGFKKSENAMAIHFL